MICNFSDAMAEINRLGTFEKILRAEVESWKTTVAESVKQVEASDKLYRSQCAEISRLREALEKITRWASAKNRACEDINDDDAYMDIPELDIDIIQQAEAALQGKLEKGKAKIRNLNDEIQARAEDYSKPEKGE